MKDNLIRKQELLYAENMPRRKPDFIKEAEKKKH
jgi:hypothetical protein